MMAAFGSKLRTGVGNRLFFWCPGCDEAHVVAHGQDGWGWNGSGDAPVFTPSVLVTGYGRKHHEIRCHSFVGCNGAQPGQITFLADCTHALAGQTVALPDWPSPDWRGG